MAEHEKVGYHKSPHAEGTCLVCESQREAEEAQEEVEAWKLRFKAIVDEDRPDMAGNAVLHLQAEVERLRADLAQVQAEASVRGDRVVEYRERCQQAEARLREVVEAASRYRWLQDEAWGQGGGFVSEIVAAQRALDAALAAAAQPKEENHG